MVSQFFKSMGFGRRDQSCMITVANIVDASDIGKNSIVHKF